MSKSYEKLITLLKQMFQLDQADLDFGIYRIMNYKRKEIEKFLNEDLLPQVHSQLEKYISTKQKSLKKDLEDLKKTLDETGVAYESSAKYVALKNQLEAGMDIEKVEAEVYSHLTDFFSRYYDNGDFISQRRYKQGIYAIPYEGEEVKLYWANADQYYIKTAEYFRDYTFTLPDGKKVHFKLVDASTETDNNKSVKNKERRFVLYQAEPVKLENGELYIQFEYKVHASKQKDLNDEAIETVKEMVVKGNRSFSSFIGIFAPRPTEANPSRTLLEKHLNDYTARNTFDYFIHKDLGGFLRRELDFYLKNEVMFLDDLDTENEVRIEQYITKIKVIKNIGRKIIAFLEQIENFQKKLWLKKKFVVQTDYCMTLDRIDENFYPEIAANKAQVEEWKKLFAIEELEGYSEPLSVEFLRANPYLVLDTAFFGEEFKERLIQSIDNIDEKTDGLLIKSENFQALNLLAERCKEQVKCVYIDPPYNTENDGFLYKDSLKHSTWVSMMYDRLLLAKNLMSDDGWLCVSIDDREVHRLLCLVENIFDQDNVVNTVSIKMSHLSGMKMAHIENKIPKLKEYLIVIAKNNESAKLIPQYEPAEWEDVFDRYTSFIEWDENDPSNYTKWKKVSLKNAALNRGININDKKEYTEFKIKNAQRIFRTAVNDSEEVKNNPKDEKFRLIETATGMKKYVYKAEEVLFASQYLKEFDGKKLPAKILGDIWLDIGINNLHNEGGVQFPNGKKPLKLIDRVINMCSSNNGIVLDFFAGSGTTVHSVAYGNKDNINRKYIAVEMGDYFESKLLQRAKKIIYSDSWLLDRPTSRKGISHMFKYLKLESYEDTLNNLEIRRSKEQQIVLEQFADIREQYMLSYMLDKETEGSKSLLNIDQFANPFEYKMKIANGQETKETVIDLVETFNYLLGLVVTRIDAKKSFDTEPDDSSEILGAVRLIPAKEGRGEYMFKEVEGHTLSGDKVLIIWRTLTGDIAKDNAALDAYFKKKKYSTQDFEFDRIYVNGDNNLQNMKQEDERWKVLLTEKEFKRLMFDVQDV